MRGECIHQQDVAPVHCAVNAGRGRQEGWVDRCTTVQLDVLEQRRLLSFFGEWYYL